MTRLIRRKFWGFLHHYFGIRLGFSIPINVFDYGLRINHYGTIVVNTKARIGKWCDIHACVNIGESLDKRHPVWEIIAGLARERNYLEVSL